MWLSRRFGFGRLSWGGASSRWALLGWLGLASCYESHELGELEPLEALCVPPEQAVLPGETVSLTALLTGEVRGTTFAWLLESGDPAEISSTAYDDGRRIEVIAAAGGRFGYRFEARDPLLREASCTSTLISVEGPPYVRCPRVPEVVPVGVALDVSAVVVEDVGVEWMRWETRAAPPSAHAVEGSSPRFFYTPAIEGDYSHRFTVRDVEGHEVSCDLAFEALRAPELECPGPASIPRGELHAVGELRLSASSGVELSVAAAGLDAERLHFLFSAAGILSMRVDAEGTYVVRVGATDAKGLTGECRFVLEVFDPAPRVRCPAHRSTRPQDEVLLSAEATDRGGAIVTRRWSLVAAPPASAGGMLVDEGGGVARFMPDVVGDYRLRFMAVDDDGLVRHCETLVQARVEDGLRVELSWDREGDLDLHLLHPDATRWPWVASPEMHLNCFFYSCRDCLPWFSAASWDDPCMDLDNREGFGPENIRIEGPAKGSYAVGVHGYASEGEATLRIYCKENGQAPVAVLGPMFIPHAREESNPENREYFWPAAEILVDEAGRCTVMPLLNRAGEPYVVLFWHAQVQRHPPG